jgi:hypothetical protein
VSLESLRLHQIVMSPAFETGPSSEFGRLCSTLLARISTANKLKLQQLAVTILQWSKQNPQASAGQIQNIVASYGSVLMPVPAGKNSQATVTVSTMNAWITLAMLVAIHIREYRRGDLDSLNPMSETTSNSLQMAMDRRSRFVEALSNILKTSHNTEATIIQNLKG